MSPIRAYRGNITPPEAPCWWFMNILPIYTSGGACSDLTGYTINGLSWSANAQTVFNGLGINYYYYPYYLALLGTFQDAVFISYYGTYSSIPTFTALDCTGTPFISWTKLSDTGAPCKDTYCYQATLKSGSTANVSNFTPFPGYIELIDWQAQFPSFGIDLMTVPNQIIFKNAIINIFGGAADVTFTQTVSEVTVTIKNIWSNINPYITDYIGGPQTIFNQIDCP